MKRPSSVVRWCVPILLLLAIAPQAARAGPRVGVRFGPIGFGHHGGFYGGWSGGHHHGYGYFGYDPFRPYYSGWWDPWRSEEHTSELQSLS
jgi:hypothetical protein